MERRGRRGQEEMVGFVLIIVLVAVIVLVFLAISIRPGKPKESREIENFLHSSLLYTTSCQPRASEVYNLKDLISGCYENKNCLLGEACEILNKTIIGLVENSFTLGEESKYKGYIFKISKENEIIYYLSKGNKTGNRMADEVPVYVSGDTASARLELYY